MSEQSEEGETSDLSCVQTTAVHSVCLAHTRSFNNRRTADLSSCVPVFHTQQRHEDPSSLFTQYSFHYQLPGFSPACLWLFHPVHRGACALTVHTDICPWRNVTTIADVEMLSPVLSWLQITTGPRSVAGPCSRGSCFCPLEKENRCRACAAPAVSPQSLRLIHADV